MIGGQGVVGMTPISYEKPADYSATDIHPVVFQREELADSVRSASLIAENTKVRYGAIPSLRQSMV